jgi:Protein of unknown function (DUF1579)
VTTKRSPATPVRASVYDARQSFSTSGSGRVTQMRWLKFVILAALAAPIPTIAQADVKIDMPALMERAAPGTGQKALEPLAGRGRVTKSIFVLSPPGHPLNSENMITKRQWVADGRFLIDTTTGLVGGKPYFRTGILGYNNIDKRYEWTTADNQTPIMMTYYAAKGSGAGGLIDMAGSFTDPGVTGDQNVGKTIPMLMTIRVVNSRDEESVNSSQSQEIRDA